MKTIFTAAALIIPTLALAAPGDHGKDRFPIDIAQAEARQAERFAKLDANADGSVTQAEFEEADVQFGKRERHHAHMKRMKRHGERHEGAKSRMKEHREAMRDAHQKALFDILDTDKDGQLSEEEHAAKSKETRKLAHRRVMFARMDANDDGVLVADELGRRLERLRALDSDGDGQVTREEMRAGRALLREQRRAALS